ncbi:hypothetical protein [Thiocapsa bogorovii]|uniref:hypothetical protein n=1 Tax=Thiocapsa bogorovii TaxID=521689 RepID=UPI001E47B85A|nr:hypothetical protein [Thiocapsa bogorovii]UHD16178.1 hypothetical protein LT988_23515 [Thiocapsa bogorovii]
MIVALGDSSEHAMARDSSPVLPSLAVLAAALVAGVAFLYMVKLMHDMSASVALMAREMSSMSADMGRMRQDMTSLARDVSGMREQVATLPAIADDMGRMRIAMERLSGIVGGGDQIPAVNPMGVIQQMIPGSDRR